MEENSLGLLSRGSDIAPCNLKAALFWRHYRFLRSEPHGSPATMSLLTLGTYVILKQRSLQPIALVNSNFASHEKQRVSKAD